MSDYRNSLIAFYEDNDRATEVLDAMVRYFDETVIKEFVEFFERHHEARVMLMKQEFATVGDLPDSLEGSWTTRDEAGEDSFLSLAEDIEQYDAVLVCWDRENCEVTRIFAIEGTVPYVTKSVTELFPLV